MQEIELVNVTTFIGLDNRIYVLEWLPMTECWILNELVPVFTNCEK